MVRNPALLLLVASALVAPTGAFAQFVRLGGVVVRGVRWAG